MIILKETKGRVKCISTDNYYVLDTHHILGIAGPHISTISILITTLLPSPFSYSRGLETGSIF